MALTITTVGEAIDFLNRFPRNMPLVKEEPFANCYTQIFISGQSSFCMVPTEEIIVNGEVIIDYIYTHFKDCPENTEGSITAVVI